MKIRPLHDRVIIKRNLEADKTASGLLFVPDNAREKPLEGEVLAVGPGARTPKGEIIPMEVSVGDKVLFSKYSLTEVKLDGEDYLILQESAILAVL